MSNSNDFMFNCGKCPGQFYGLRELRKHECKIQIKKLNTISELPNIRAAVVEVKVNTAEKRKIF